MAFYDHQPLIQPLYRVVTDMMNGDIAVPRFQRPGTERTWSPEQRRELLDSLLRGFPIGTILLWPSKLEMNTFDQVGGFQIAKLPQGSLRRYLLDGHQRLSSIVKILGQGLLSDGAQPIQDTNEYWYFDLGEEQPPISSLNRFRMMEFDTEADAQEYEAKTEQALLLPLRIILNRAELNRWLRHHPDLTDKQLREAENLRDSLREYNLPIMQLQAGNLQDAAESFKRINSSGTPMSSFFMVTALAYRENFDPQQIFGEMRATYLEPLGWAEVEDSDLLRICVGINGDDPTTLEVEKLADKLAKNQQVIEQAFVAAAKVAKIFVEIGVHGPQTLPYSGQLITAAIIWAKENLEDTEQNKQALMRWFWLSSYGEFFISGNRRSTFAYARNVLLALLQGKDPQADSELKVTRKVKPLTKFDFRAVRSLMCLLAMARCQDQNNYAGAAHRALLKGPSSVSLLRTNGKRSDWWNLLIVTDGVDLNQIRAELRNCNQLIGPTEPLQLLGFTAEMMQTADPLIARRKQIEENERAWVKEQTGLEWDEGVVRVVEH